MKIHNLKARKLMLGQRSLFRYRSDILDDPPV